jgi:excisionase family DNA binding protein
MAIPAGERLVLTMEDAAERLCIGRTLMYLLVKTGAIESVHIGRLRRVPAKALDAFVRQLQQRTADNADSADKRDLRD